MTTTHLIHDLPHIIALKAELDRAQAVVDVPGHYTRGEALCPRASDTYNRAAEAYFAATDEALAKLKQLEASIAVAYGLPNFSL